MNVKRIAILVVLLVSTIILSGRFLPGLSLVAQQSPRVETGDPYPPPATPSRAEPTATSIASYPWPQTPTPPRPVTPLPSPTLISPTPTTVPSLEMRRALEYIAEQEGIAIEDLVVIHEHPRSYPLLDRRFMAFTIVKRHLPPRCFNLLVDLEDGSVSVGDDVDAIERAEAEVRQAQYGKFDPSLYERLQTVEDHELLPVAIWIGGQRGRSREQLYAILADRYPAVREALERGSIPFDVGDPVLAQQIHDEYVQLQREDVSVRVDPLVTYLESRGVEVRRYDYLPSVTATLSKTLIQELTQRDDVQKIYLIEGEEKLALSTATGTNRVAPVWSDGFDSTGLTISIVEMGNVDWDNSWLNHAPLRRVGTSGETDHATRVASCAASFTDTLKGMAQGATILSAGEDGSMADIYDAVEWAEREAHRAKYGKLEPALFERLETMGAEQLSPLPTPPVDSQGVGERLIPLHEKRGGGIWGAEKNVASLSIGCGSGFVGGL